MGIGLLKKLAPTKATMAGIGKGYSDFAERQEKRGKTMATKQFVAAFQQAQMTGDPKDIERVLADPSFLDADPASRQRAMSSYQNLRGRDASRDLALRRFEGAHDKDVSDTLFDASKLSAEGWDVAVENEEGDLPSGRHSINMPKPAISILGRGPDLQALWKDKITQSKQKSERQLLGIQMQEEKLVAQKAKNQKFLEVGDTDARHLRALAKSGVTYLEHMGWETQERLAPAMVEMGISLTKPRPMPMAFIRQISEYNAALAELDALEKVIDEYGGVGLVQGVMSWKWWRGTDSQNALAAINVARQRIGRTLEGGVLRKEDEEKYKTILPTILDADSLARFKMANLKKMIQMNKEKMMEAWEELGANGTEESMENADLIVERAVILGILPATWNRRIGEGPIDVVIGGRQ
jgi:hypothetical protein